jgi:hypothetical protein
LPRSSCSIDEIPHALSSKNVYTSKDLSISAIDETKDKSMKYIADRFFPVRKMPCSAKDLFIDNVEWMEDEENDG